MKGGNYETEDAVKAVLSYYIFSGMQPETAALLEKMSATDTEKLNLVLDGLDDLLGFLRRRSERDNLPVRTS